MKCLFFGCLFLSFVLTGKAQSGNEFTYVDNQALAIPIGHTYSSDSLAAYMMSKFTSDRERARGIYAWVINNIRYDKDSMYPINWSMEHAEKIAATLRRRSGVCENYAALFTDIAVKSSLPSFVVNGYTQTTSAGRAGHSWCAILVDNKWFLCDPTWDNDHRFGNKYFLVNPAEFIESHIPFDPMWQLQEYPVSESDFGNHFFRSKKDRAPFNFTDSIRNFLLLDSLQQMEAANRRIRQAGIGNERQKYWVAYNQMKIAGIRGEQDMNLYNSAVDDLNKANNFFNKYAEYRNSRFTPARSDGELKSLLDPIALLISSASTKIGQIGRETENFQYDTGSIKDRLNALAEKLSTQKDFVKQYLAAAAPDREKLFYR